jgi:exonuclease III
MRVLLQNIQWLPLSIRNQKHEEIVRWIQQDQGDVAILTEINTYWPKVPAHQQWEERSERLFSQGLKSRFSYNKTEEAASNVQYGGVGALAVGETRHRLCSTGEDETGLGRWVWLRYKGKGGMHLRVVGAYRPNPKGEGENTVYMQHQRYLLKHQDPRDSQLAFDQDLQQAIKTWNEVGDHIVIALDANDDLRNGPVKRLMARQGLQEAILTKHRDKPTVATYNRNHDCKPIDGIFATRGINITAAGYYAFDEAIHSPHRALWVDIDLASVFGTKVGPSDKAEARRLKIKDPRVVKKYNTILTKELLRLKLPHRLFLLESKVRAGEISRAQALDYEDIHQSALNSNVNLEEKSSRSEKKRSRSSAKRK